VTGFLPYFYCSLLFIFKPFLKYIIPIPLHVVEAGNLRDISGNTFNKENVELQCKFCYSVSCVEEPQLKIKKWVTCDNEIPVPKLIASLLTYCIYDASFSNELH
jgi:hypothetical protein